MAEYRIVARVDPQTAAGSAKVKQDLKGIQAEARATESALNRSFDQAQFDKTIGGLVNRIGQLDKSIGGLAGTNSTLARANETLGQSLDRVAAGAAKTGAQTKQLGQSADDAATKEKGLEAALRRVLAATDADSLALVKHNALLADAKRLLDAGKISQEQFARVQAQGAAITQEVTGKTGQQRMGLQQLGFQLGDVATMYSLGAKPAQIFGSQIGQITQAVQLMSGGTSKFASFLGGPWGIALSVGLIALTPLVAKLFEGNDALGDAIDKLRKDAEETELTARANEAWGKTVEGVTAAINDQKRALDEKIKGMKSEAEQARDLAAKNLALITTRRLDTEAMIAQRLEQARIQEAYLGSPEAANDPLATAKAVQIRAQIAAAERQLEQASKAARTAEQNLQNAQSFLDVEVGTRQADAVGGIAHKYDLMVESARRRAAAEGLVGDALAAQIKLIRQRQAAEEKTERDRASAASRASRSPLGEGVAGFRSREQAIGIAGREFQKLGLDVSGNSQFRRTTGHANDAQHNRTAIDVDVPGAVDSTPTAPDIRKKYDAMARRYAARGYRVLWAGLVYEPDGTTRPITGKNKHYGHLHLEAPGTIVGKPTGASSEAQAQREEGAAAKVQERAEDFVSGVVIQAEARGLPPSRVAQLGGKIDEVFAEFERRFDRAPDFGEKWKMATALTEADAREVEQSFDQAYVAPLKRLQDLQGLVGVDRAIMNAKLDETLRLGRELTPVEAQLIDNSIRQSDQLTAQAQILEQVLGPLNQYRATIAALNELMAKGTITQNAYNAQVAQLTADTVGIFSGVSGADPNTGMTYGDMGAVSEESARYATQLAELEAHREQILAMGISYDALEENARRDHMNRLAEIDAARKDVALGHAEEIFGNMAEIAKTGLGEQSAVYKALFAMEKAVAIARAVVAIQTGIALASAQPWPLNLGAIASVVAATASIVSNISSVALSFKDGGMVHGPGGPRSDSVPANLSNGEFVVNADATRRNRSLLEAINGGRGARRGFANGGYVGAAPGAGDTYAISFGDVILQGHQGSAAEGRAYGSEVRKQLGRIVDDRIADQRRAGGQLTRGRGSVMA